MNSIFKLQNVFLRRNGVEILRGIEWCVANGDNWALVGLNGSGKTSILRCATGDFWASSGEVKLFGEVLGHGASLPELKKKIAWVGAAVDRWLPFDETSLRIVVTGLHTTCQIFHQPSDNEYSQALAIMNMLGCAHLAERIFGKLSQGEKQAVRISRALVSRPQVLVLDEACAGLDLKAREEFLERVNSLSGCQLFFVTHHIEEIPPCINKVLLINDGKVFFAGDKSEALTNEKLSDIYGVSIKVHADSAGRYWAQVIP